MVKFYEGVSSVDPQIYELAKSELSRQQQTVELIASENFVPESILELQGSVLTNKYAEGYPHKKYYGGCSFVEAIEEIACERAKKLFGAEHANVQPHSGTQANMAVYFAVLNPGDTILSMSLACGGHLSHGHPVNFTGKLYKVVNYGVSRDTETIDYDEVLKLAKEHKPKMIVAGASAYPRILDFKRFKEIADEVGAILLVDMAHIAGLVAGGVHPNPTFYADFVTSTTHKTLRGARGAFILCKSEYAQALDKAVFPGAQGGPLVHVIAAKAVTFKLAMEPEFKEYADCVVKNAKALAKALSDLGFRIVSGGTDNHLMLVDLRPKNITGKEAEKVLEEVGITVNKNMIPFDPQKPMVTSGIRLGTPAVTTRGLKEKDMEKIALFIDKAISFRDNQTELSKIKQQVKEFISQFPLYEKRLF